MPRPRRQPPPPPPTRVVPLAPKAAPEDASIQDQESTSQDHSEKAGVVDEKRRASNTCMVPSCKRTGCDLWTHSQYTPPSTDSCSRRSQCRAICSTQKSDLVELQLIRDRLHGLPALPIETDDDGDLVRLFNEFFVEKFEPIALIYRPPLQMSSFKTNALGCALNSPIYCMSIIATAHAGNMARHQPAESVSQRDRRLTASLHTRILIRIREELKKKPSPANVEFLLFGIVALCQFEFNAGNLDSLRCHWRGLRALVAERGGLCNLGMSMPYVVRLDQGIAMLTGQLPLYPSPAPTLVRRPRGVKQQYGMAFERLGKEYPYLSPEIVSFCEDAAMLIDVKETDGVTFDPACRLRKPLVRSLHFFYFLRDVVEGQKVILNAQFYDSGSIEECVVLAVGIVTYITAQANHIPTISTISAGRIAKIMNSDGILSVWEGCEELLLWILFTCSIPGIEHEGSERVGEMLITTIVKLHDTTWKDKSVKEDIRLMLCSYIWARTLTEDYDKVWDWLMEKSSATADHEEDGFI